MLTGFKAAKTTEQNEPYSADGHDLRLLTIVIAGNLSFDFIDSDEF